MDQSTVDSHKGTLLGKRKSSSKTQGIAGPHVSPLQILNEKYPGLSFEVTLLPATKIPEFQCSVVFNEETYTASAFSKKNAKQTVAIQILRDLKEVPGSPYGTHHVFTPPPYYNIDFTEDEPFILPPLDQIVSPQPSKKPKISSAPNSAKKSKVKEDDNARNPVMVLNERSIEKLDWVISPSEVLEKTFVAKVTVGQKMFEGSGQNKKMAKFYAASAAVRELFGITTAIIPNQVAIDCSGEETPDAGKLPDLVMDLILQKFATLTGDLTAQEAKYKVMAGIVMTRTNDLDVSSGEVVSLATGTKSISGEFISTMGVALNDCHAEIVSRRGLKKFLYQQLLLQISGLATDPIFIRLPNRSYRLKHDVFFHLYISSAPCGDARIFSPHETEEQNDRHPNRRARGQLRTKIESGEGTIPITDEAFVMKGLQPFDSIIGGERLRTMSCSDKIARWNVLGVQGSLLSTVIEPIYLSSVVLGSLYHGQHLQRALYGRVVEALNSLEEDETTISPPFKINKPLLAVVSSPVKRSTTKAPNLGLHWTNGDDAATVVEMAKGKTITGDSSNLCKKELFKHFTDLQRTINEESKHIINTYSDAKNKAYAYKEVKQKLYESIEKSKLGIWMKKPAECDEFNNN